MEILDSTFTTASFVLIALVLGALLCAHLISPAERRLVTATALTLAGGFVLTRGGEAPLLLIGAWTTAVGGRMLLRATVEWDAESGTRLGPVAAVILLPPAFFGAIMLTGVVLSLVVSPARLVLRLLGG